MASVLWSCTTLIHAMSVIFIQRSSVAQTVMPDVEGFEGGTVTLPCTLTQQGTLRWIGGGGGSGGNVIATKPSGGTAIIDINSPLKDVASITGEFNLRISSLSTDRDNKQFICADSGPGGGSQVTTVRVLARITGASISEGNNGKVTLTAGEPKTLTCAVTGNPNPGPFYSWTVDDRTVAGQGSTFSVTADKSTKTVKCTATNSYSNGSVLSTEETTATLNVLYLDSPTTSTPVTVPENERVTLSCRAEGNPPPHFEWQRSGTTEVRRSPDYTIENVKRSAAGEYTCTVSNSVGSGQATVTLVVQYPPSVTVTYDSSTQTLTCTADGVPNTYIFSPWEHRVGEKLVQTLHTNSTTLTLPGTLTYEDTGDYVCSVSNGIKQTQTGHQYIAPGTAAVFQDQKQSLTLGFGNTEEIAVPFYTHSETSNVTVEWRKSGDSNLLQSHREGKSPVSLVFHGQTVSIEGTVTVLTLRDVTQSDEGNYTVCVTNEVNGVTETKHRSVYVKVSKQRVLDEGTNVGAVVGGTVAAVVVVVVIAVGVVWFRRTQLKEPPGMMAHRSISAGGTSQSSNRSVPLYEVTSLEQNYQNVRLEPQYEQLQKQEQQTRDKYQHTENADYENSRTQSYENCSGRYDQNEVVIHYENGFSNPAGNTGLGRCGRDIRETVDYEIMRDNTESKNRGGIENTTSVVYENGESVDYENRRTGDHKTGQ